VHKFNFGIKTLILQDKNKNNVALCIWILIHWLDKRVACISNQVSNFEFDASGNVSAFQKRLQPMESQGMVHYSGQNLGSRQTASKEDSQFPTIFFSSIYLITIFNKHIALGRGSIHISLVDLFIMPWTTYQLQLSSAISSPFISVS